jgi:glycosyltransferase involved in cell wall biosynthesis
MGLWGVKNTARFIGVSPAVPEIYRQQFGLEISSFDLNTHLGVDTQLFCPASNPQGAKLRQRWLNDEAEDALVVGYCGRFEEYKGITDLVAAVERARELTRFDIRLMALGSGSLRDELLQQAEECNWLTIHERVPHAEVAEFLQALDLFVMPARKSATHEEHDGHAVIEALSCGLPCIGTDSGALKDLLEDVGSITPCGDRNTLVRSLQDFIEGFDKRSGWAKNDAGRKKILQHFSLDAVSDRNWQTYRRAVKDWKSKVGECQSI